MTVEELEKNLKLGSLNNLYLLYGEEEYLLETNLKKIKKIFGELIEGINYIQIDDKNISKIIDDIETPAFGYPKKLIIAKDTGLFKKEVRGKKKEETTQKKLKKEQTLLNKISEYIKANNTQIQDNVIIIFVEKEISNNELYKTIEELGTVCNFERLKPIQIAKRIKAIVSAYKVKIDDSTLNYFIETCGTSMLVLINEIRKLIEYVGENGIITVQDIDKLSIKELDSVIFDLTDSLGKKDTAKALEILHELLYNKEPIQKILITLYNHFKKLYLVILAQQYNENIADVLKLKPNQMFLITKYKKQASYFNKTELREILQKLIDLDYKTKKGLIDINIGLEAILCF